MFTTKGNKTTQKYNAEDGCKATKSKNNDQKKIQNNFKYSNSCINTPTWALDDDNKVI